MTYIYSLYDVHTDKLLYRGTPTQLIEAGLYKTMGAPNAAWRSQVEGAKPRRWRVERELPEPLKQKKPYRHKAAGCSTEAAAKLPHRCSPPAAELQRSSPEGGASFKGSALQEDVHWLCRYNAKARKMGRKELNYGMWSALGKPEEPV